jgi:hypothetical protein
VTCKANEAKCLSQTELAKGINLLAADAEANTTPGPGIAQAAKMKEFSSKT